MDAVTSGTLRSHTRALADSSCEDSGARSGGRADIDGRTMASSGPGKAGHITSHVATDVEIALVGDRDPSGQVARQGMIPVPITDEERTGSWSQRPRVSLSVSDDEVLESVLDRAASSFGVVENSNWSLG